MWRRNFLSASAGALTCRRRLSPRTRSRVSDAYYLSFPVTIYPGCDMGIRCFAGGKDKKRKKQQAFKRQQANHPSPATTTPAKPSPQQPSTSSRSISATNPPGSDSTTLSSSFPNKKDQMTKMELIPRDDWLEQYESWQVQSSKPKSLKDLTSLSPSAPSPDGVMKQDITPSLLQMEDMYDPKIHLPYAPTDWTGYEPATDLSDALQQQIGVMGKPITTAEYMRQALTHPLYGYYTNPPASQLEKKLQQQGGTNDDWDDDEWDDEPEESSSSKKSTVFGSGGDFVTAPEVSHVFGYCIGIWWYTQWKDGTIGSKVNLVELGPGRGTLMVDLLQLATSNNLREFGEAIDTVHLVEASLDLRKEQQESLEKALGHIIDFEFAIAFEDPIEKRKRELENGSQEDITASSNKIPIRVQWHDDFMSFRHNRDESIPCMFVLQEFLDALPVHVFEKREDGWRERLVDVVDQEENPPNPDNTPLVPRLRQVVAPGPTPASDLLIPKTAQYEQAPEGTVIEICPEAIFLIQDMAKVLEESGGVALMVDYGQEGTGDTLRAFSNHKQVGLTSYPGQVDVTADVDFYALKHCLTPHDDADQERIIHAFGPITQGEFLMKMGASEMIIHKIEQDDTTEEQAQQLAQALKFLVLPEHMGEKFKVMALAKKRDGIFGPPAF